MQHTRTHKLLRSATELPRHAICRRQPKIAQIEVCFIGRTEYIVGLNIAMVDAIAVTMLEGIENLKERRFEGFVLQVEMSARNQGGHIAAGAKVHNQEKELVLDEDLVKSDDGRMSTNSSVEVSFGGLKHGRLRALLSNGHALDST